MNPRFARAWMAAPFGVAALAQAQDNAPEPLCGAATEDGRTVGYVQTGNGRVSVDARGVPLADLLRAIAECDGIAVIVDDDARASLTERMTTAFHDLSVPNALDVLLRSRDFQLHYVGSWHGPAETSPNRLWILSTDHALRARWSIAAPPVGLPHAHDEADVLESIDAVVAASDVTLASTELGVLAVSDADENVRQEAVYALGELPAADSLVILEQAIRDPAIRVREAAVLTLADLHDDGAVRLLSAALYDSSAAVREQAVYALGAIGSDAALESIRTALLSGDGAVRDAAGEALAEIGERSP